MNGLELLKEDHRKAQELFEQSKRSGTRDSANRSSAGLMARI
jgi:hypothetical protein